MSIEDQMHIVGIMMGWIIVAGYVWSVLNYFVKLPKRKMTAPRVDDSSTRKQRTVFKRAVMKSHYYVPFFILMVMILHLTVELFRVGFFITGVITFSLMLLQILIGGYGLYVKHKRRGPWFYGHRTVAVLLGISIIIHVITVVILKP